MTHCRQASWICGGLLAYESKLWPGAQHVTALRRAVKCACGTRVSESTAHARACVLAFFSLCKKRFAEHWCRARHGCMPACGERACERTLAFEGRSARKRVWNLMQNLRKSLPLPSHGRHNRGTQESPPPRRRDKGRRLKVSSSSNGTSTRGTEHGDLCVGGADYIDPAGSCALRNARARNFDGE